MDACPTRDDGTHESRVIDPRLPSSANLCCVSEDVWWPHPSPRPHHSQPRSRLPPWSCQGNGHEGPSAVAVVVESSQSAGPKRERGRSRRQPSRRQRARQIRSSSKRLGAFSAHSLCLLFFVSFLVDGAARVYAFTNTLAPAATGTSLDKSDCLSVFCHSLNTAPTIPINHRPPWLSL